MRTSRAPALLQLASLIALVPLFLAFGGIHISNAALVAPHFTPSAHSDHAAASTSERKSLAWGPEQPHRRFVSSASHNLDDPHQAQAAIALYAATSAPGSKDPHAVASRLARELLLTAANAGADNKAVGFYIRQDSYTDTRTAISHIYIRQLVNGIEVADGDINVNVDADGNILSYGSSLYTGAIPTPFTNPLHAAEADAASPAETAARCDELRTLISERLTAALQRERQHMPPARRGQQLVMKTGGAALPDLLPLQEELYELCAEPSDHPLLQGADLGSRPLGSLAHPSKVASSYDGSRTPIIDPRLALLGFLEQATPDAELSARLSRDPEQYVGQIYTTFEHTFHPGSTGSQQGEQVEHLHNVPGATGPVPARLVYLQHPRTEGSDETILNLVWRFEVPMSDNAYEVYVDATRPRTISAVLDWVSSMPADNMFARERAERMREREAEQKRRAALIAKARKTSKYIPSLIAPTFGASKNAQAEEPGTPLVPQYRVFKWGINDPSEGHRSLELGAHDTLASPLGWHTVPHLLTPFPDAVDPARRVVGNETRYLDTRGNNVMAQIHNDTNIDWIHAHRAKGVENASHLVFDFELGWRKADKTHATHPLPAEYADAAISQLFYTVNQIHDLNYRYGFDERAGNFQEANFGRGGQDRDGIIANAQDGSGTDNADFMTPPDGSRGRMRMYTWDLSTPYRDGDLEAGIVIHEATHGTSTRLTGGPANSGCLGWGEAGGMGEGWGDYFATNIRRTEAARHDWTMGRWAANSTGGIRHYPYSTNMTLNPETYKTLDGPSYFGVHAIGEVWATMLNEVEERLVSKHGFAPSLFPPMIDAPAAEQDAFYLPEHGRGANGGGSKQRASKARIPRHGNTLTMQLVMDGMKLQPCRPSFFDARDAIVQSDVHLTGGNNTCEIWKAFAKRGLGVDAQVVGKTPWGGGIRTDGHKVPKKCRNDLPNDDDEE